VKVLVVALVAGMLAASLSCVLGHMWVVLHDRSGGTGGSGGHLRKDLPANVIINVATSRSEKSANTAGGAAAAAAAAADAVARTAVPGVAYAAAPVAATAPATPPPATSATTTAAVKVDQTSQAAIASEPALPLAKRLTLADVKLWHPESSALAFKCGPSAPKVPVTAIDGRPMFLKAGCDPNHRNHCCSPGIWCGRTASHCRGVDYRKTGAYDAELYALNTRLGPLAKSLQLTGLEWRQDKLCGARSRKSVEVYASATAAAKETFPGCNPDSATAYFCHKGKCTIAPESGSDEAAGTDYRLAESWKMAQKPVSHNSHINEHIALFNSNQHTFEEIRVPDGALQKGFEAHPSIKSPHWYHITMANKRSTTGAELEKDLKRLGVPADDITYVEAVTPSMINGNRWKVPGKGSDKERGCLLAHLKMMKLAYDAGHPVAVVVEADVSTRLVGMWDRPVELSDSGEKKRGKTNVGLTLADVIAGLEKHDKEERTQWEICQICITCAGSSDCKSYSKEMLAALNQGETIIHRHPTKHYSAWGTVSYMVSRAGMARILDAVWPGGKNGKAYADLPNGAHFRTSGGIQADVVLYATTRPEATFLSARPLLDSKAIESDVHPGHLSTHVRSKYLLESALYIEGGSLYEHMYTADALAGGEA
jgi:hypothetical protein